ncbi:MAG: alpha-mannosidase [Candidatus Aminicenantes bacterium]|nr:MAG: alpha-mannosidase [Candidatus Aminicenantes bacterium]
MSAKTLFLVCNAHLDPVWLWEWEEGAAEALSTFRTAAQLCEEFKEFVFNHNEAVLYQWIEDYEPDLFTKIKKLIRNRKWHIMGGWYLQPDCNLPSGESLVRQILVGKRYFKKKFGTEPTTAVNLDPFGHTRGLVQILKKSGYSSYLFCRPDPKELKLPGDDFIWVGYDGSEILAHRARYHYNSQKGKAKDRVKNWMKENPDQQTGILLWGIGDHGGGPSRIDLEKLRELITEKSGWKVRHGIPEDYFRIIGQRKDRLPRYDQDINPWAVGCYTTMALVKQGHRQLENSYFMAEKMVTLAALQGLLDYPRKELHEALEDLLFCEFHDILPGSSIPGVEVHTLQRMGHGLEILSRLKAKAFFALLSGQQQAEEGEFPVFVYNPHPYPVKETIICEFQPYEPNEDRNIVRVPEVSEGDGRIIPSQMEKESSNIAVDWRKKVVFQAELKPSQLSRFSCRLKEEELKSEKKERKKRSLVFQSGNREVVINRKTGLVDRYCINGYDFLNSRSFCALAIEDYPDPWGMLVRGFRNVKGSFMLMTKEESARFAGISASELEPVRIIEDGPVRTIVEALFKYKNSAICQRYKIPRKGSEFEVEILVFWSEKDCMLKISVPTPFKDGSCKGQVAYGVEDFKREGEELIAQKWIAASSSDKKYALTVINSGIYGFDYAEGELRLSLLRPAGYSAHPVGEGIPIVPQDRFEPRIDQGMRTFRFWINGGKAADRQKKIDHEALIKNEALMTLSCFPSGEGKKIHPGILLGDPVVQVTAIKMAEGKKWLLIRFFEPTGKKRKTDISIPFLKTSFDVSLGGFEIKTVAVDLDTKEVFEVDLMERRLKKG